MESLSDLLVHGEAVIQRSRDVCLVAWWLLQSPHRAHLARYIAGATGVVCSLCGLPVEARDHVAARGDDLVHVVCAFGAARLRRREACRRLT